jgi:nuclear transport factor 2 (NTF2) superfamily protein
VFESTGPAPDGVRSEGADAVRAVFADMFASTTEPRFVEEDLFCSGNRGFLRWRYEWKNDDGSDGHVRGVDIMRLDDGLVTEKLSYVKG